MAQLMVDNPVPRDPTSTLPGEWPTTVIVRLCDRPNGRDGTLAFDVWFDDLDALDETIAALRDARLTLTSRMPYVTKRAAELEWGDDLLLDGDDGRRVKVQSVVIGHDIVTVRYVDPDRAEWQRLRDGDITDGDAGMSVCRFDRGAHVNVLGAATVSAIR